MQIVRYAGHGSVLLQALLAVELGFRLPLGVGRIGEVAVRIVGISSTFFAATRTRITG